MSKQAALMAAPKRIDLGCQIGEDAAVAQVRGHWPEGMLGECDTTQHVVGELLLVHRERVEEDAVVQLQLVADVLPATSHQADILRGVQPAPWVEVLTHAVLVGLDNRM